MADIDLKELFNQKQREFKVEGSGSTRFEKDFTAAVNWSIGKINRQADLETRITKITSPDGTVALDDEYMDGLSDAVSLRLIQFGHRMRNDDIDVKIIAATLNDNINMIRQDILNQAIADDVDDETDFVALGALGA